MGEAGGEGEAGVDRGERGARERRSDTDAASQGELLDFSVHYQCE